MEGRYLSGGVGGGVKVSDHWPGVSWRKEDTARTRLCGDRKNFWGVFGFGLPAVIKKRAVH